MAVRYNVSYADDLTSVTEKLYQDGNNNPSFSQIACATLGKPAPETPLDEPPSLGGEMYDGLRKRLPQLKRDLEKRGHAVCLITRQAYLGDSERKPFTEHPPTNLFEVGLCLPSSASKPAGLHFRTGVDDPIWLASIGKDAEVARSFAEKAAKKIETLDDQMQEGVTSGDISPKIGNQFRRQLDAGSLANRYTLIGAQKKAAE